MGIHPTWGPFLLSFFGLTNFSLAILFLILIGLIFFPERLFCTLGFDICLRLGLLLYQFHQCFHFLVIFLIQDLWLLVLFLYSMCYILGHSCFLDLNLMLHGLTEPSVLGFPPCFLILGQNTIFLSGCCLQFCWLEFCWLGFPCLQAWVWWSFCHLSITSSFFINEQWTNIVMCIERIKATWCHKHKKLLRATPKSNPC